MTVEINNDGTLPYLRDARGQPYLDPIVAAQIAGESGSEVTDARQGYATLGDATDLPATYGIRATDPARSIDANTWVKLQSSHDDSAGMVIWTQKVGGDSADINVDGSVLVKHGKDYIGTPGYADTAQFYTLGGSNGTIIGNNDYSGYESALPWAPPDPSTGSGFVRFELGPRWPLSEVGRFNNGGDFLAGGWQTTHVGSGHTYTQADDIVTKVSGATAFALAHQGAYMLWGAAGFGGNADRIVEYLTPTTVRVETVRTISTAASATVVSPGVAVRKDGTIESQTGIKFMPKIAQTEPTTAWLSNDGTELGSVDGAGVLTMPKGKFGQGGMFQLNQYQLQLRTGSQYTDGVADVEFNAQHAAEKALVVRAFSASSSVNVFEVQNSAGTVEFGVDKNGSFGAWGHANPAAQPDAPVTLADVIAVLQAYGLTA